MLDLARLRILRLEENSFGIEDKGFDLSYRNHLNPTIKILRAKSLLSHWLYRILIFERHLEGINVILFRGNITIIKWGTSSRWSSSIYCPMRNSDDMTIRKTRPTLVTLNVKKIRIAPARFTPFWRQSSNNHWIFRVRIIKTNKIGQRFHLSESEYSSIAIPWSKAKTISLAWSYSWRTAPFSASFKPSSGHWSTCHTDYGKSKP